jgi:signal peptidase
MKKPLIKFLNIFVDILVVCVLIISVLILTITLTGKGEGKVPSLLGKAPIAVLTNSMHGDKPDDFDQGDLLICEVVDKDAENNFKVGDIVTFQNDVNGDDNLDYVTHRIYKVNKDGTYLTKGDNNTSYDQDPKGSTVFPNLEKSGILALYKGTKISGFGSVMSYLQSPTGFFLCVLLPMILFFLYQAVRVVMNIIAYNKEKALISAKEAIANADLTEEQKQKAIEEYLAAQSADSGEAEKETPPEEEKTAAVEKTGEGE